MQHFEERGRAQRFTIHAPLRYRAAGDGNWRDGMIVNISKSGVLFQIDQGVPPHREIEMRFSLPTGMAGESAAHITCRCEVARTISHPGTGMPMALAARIIKFHFGSMPAKANRLRNAAGARNAGGLS